MSNPIWRVYCKHPNGHESKNLFAADMSPCVEKNISPDIVAIGYLVGVLESSKSDKATAQLMNPHQLDKTALETALRRVTGLNGKDSSDMDISPNNFTVLFSYDEVTFTLTAIPKPAMKVLH